MVKGESCRIQYIKRTLVIYANINCRDIIRKLDALRHSNNISKRVKQPWNVVVVVDNFQYRSSLADITRLPETVEYRKIGYTFAYADGTCQIASAV